MAKTERYPPLGRTPLRVVRRGPTGKRVVGHPPQSLRSIAEVTGDRQARPARKQARRVEVGIFQGGDQFGGRTIQLIEYISHIRSLPRRTPPRAANLRSPPSPPPTVD